MSTAKGRTFWSICFIEHLFETEASSSLFHEQPQILQSLNTEIKCKFEMLSIRPLLFYFSGTCFSQLRLFESQLWKWSEGTPVAAAAATLKNLDPERDSALPVLDSEEQGTGVSISPKCALTASM